MSDDVIDVPSDWHEDFFSGLWLEVQSNSFDATATRELVDATQEALQLAPGARVLDVPCGDGRVAIELAARGYEVTGVDRVPALLDRARSHASRRAIEARWIEADMWSLAIEGPFDAALCLWGSLGYGSEDDDRRFLERLAALVPSGGGLLLETHVVETLLPWFETHGFRWAGDVGVAETRHFDPVEGRIVTDWLLSGPSARERKRSSIRLYTTRELTRHVEAAGFEIEALFGSPELEDFVTGSSRLLLVARRR